MAKILVTGGAGYVGAHCCMALAQAGHEPIVYDNLSNGHEAFVKWGPFIKGDIRDAATVRAALAVHKPAAVLHLAALIEAGVSVRDPGLFYDNNVTGGLVVLEEMRRAEIPVFVFSSTAATYGVPQRMPIDEQHPQMPINPYGWTKLMIEQAARDYSSAHGLRYGFLRYFNASGAAPDIGLGERHQPETHALPLALFTLLGRAKSFKIFGTDYDTTDGTCIRDYVHVLDLAEAHVKALTHLLNGGSDLAVNLGTGHGASVLELLSAVRVATGKEVPTEQAGRRPGDPPQLVADKHLASVLLGWAPQYSLEQLVASAWEWHALVEPRLFG